MGLYFSLKCPGCGYQFDAAYGRGGSEEPQERARKRLESGIRMDEATIVWNALKDLGDVRVEADSQPYVCHDCKELFNYDRVIIHSKEGRFVEEKGVCPTCGKDIHPVYSIDSYRFKANGEFGHGKCNYCCPKCSGHLYVTSGGIYD